MSDSFLYKSVKNAVIKRADKIDVWFESPAVELIQDPDSRIVVGVKVTRNGETRNVRALGGVVVATGGFECDTDMAQQYLGLKNYSVIGGQFNTGDGIKMCQKVGADLWHMNVFEGGFGTNSCGYAAENGGLAHQVVTLAHNPMNTGATVIVGTDGERFGNEAEIPRHGHLYENGIWENPHYPNAIYLIMDQTQYDLAVSEGALSDDYKDTVLSAATIEELAEKTGCKPETLKDTIESFNTFAEGGKDYKHNRSADYMRAFDGKMYYAMPMSGLMLNTQGGPRRNENAEVLDTNGNPIPHLYSAGEMGGITSCMYQGGTNIAECIIFGEIAGTNAAAAKDALPAYAAREQVESAPITLGMDTDLGGEATYEVGENQYVGSAQGMMGNVVTRVTVQDGKVAAVEVLEQTETEGIGTLAINELPGKFVGCATAEEIDAVDSVSGATITSNALKEAVKAALAQAK